MKLHEDKTYKPITLIAILLGIALVISLTTNILDFSGTKELRRQSNSIQKEKDSLLELVKMSQPKIEEDSLRVVGLENNIKVLDSLLEIANNSEEHYKNKWYKTYKKLQDAQNSYNNASRRERDSLAAILAKRKG